MRLENRVTVEVDEDAHRLLRVIEVLDDAAEDLPWRTDLADARDELKDMIRCSVIN